ncbi:unnamed protein product [Amoebophrya sp. A25]|nr:unnamed protein product [Amoebophrya sp. A25]|eukprot:GSA25T00018516001.1
MFASSQRRLAGMSNSTRNFLVSKLKERQTCIRRDACMPEADHKKNHPENMSELEKSFARDRRLADELLREMEGAENPDGTISKEAANGAVEQQQWAPDNIEQWLLVADALLERQRELSVQDALLALRCFFHNEIDDANLVHSLAEVLSRQLLGLSGCGSSLSERLQTLREVSCFEHEVREGCSSTRRATFFSPATEKRLQKAWKTGLSEWVRDSCGFLANDSMSRTGDRSSLMEYSSRAGGRAGALAYHGDVATTSTAGRGAEPMGIRKRTATEQLSSIVDALVEYNGCEEDAGAALGARVLDDDDEAIISSNEMETEASSSSTRMNSRSLSFRLSGHDKQRLLTLLMRHLASLDYADVCRLATFVEHSPKHTQMYNLIVLRRKTLQKQLSLHELWNMLNLQTHSTPSEEVVELFRQRLSETTAADVERTPARFDILDAVVGSSRRRFQPINASDVEEGNEDKRLAGVFPRRQVQQRFDFEREVQLRFLDAVSEWAWRKVEKKGQGTWKQVTLDRLVSLIRGYRQRAVTVAEVHDRKDGQSDPCYAIVNGGISRRAIFGEAKFSGGVVDEEWGFTSDDEGWGTSVGKGQCEQGNAHLAKTLRKYLMHCTGNMRIAC